MTTHRYGDFGIDIRFEGEEAVVGVRGDVDLATAPTLGALLGALVDQHRQHVVLDLAALAFMDASGLRVIAETSARLTRSTGTLTVRAAPAQTLRILEITGVSDLVVLEASDPNVAELGAEQRSGDRSLSVESKPIDLSADLVAVGSRANNEVIDAALRLVTSLAAATVDGADGVSVTLERHGQPATVASSNETVLRMDNDQYQTGEGPCLAAAAEGHWFHIESLAEETRWPAFVSRAAEEGIGSILSTPLIVAERPVGALNIYSNSERAFGTDEQELAALFATQASAILADAGSDANDERTGQRIASALIARDVIARAQGVLMARQHVSSDDAAAKLHRSARTAAVTVLQHAAEVVDSTNNNARKKGRGDG
ncbi:MAG TPA: anti-sigma factor antagonist [Acidimicrobiales bacterium]|nr:anti-sigma factor antagonist [Acidimicrobiales bacterium]